MKRMHALPIELPLVASGELDDSLGKFKLDKKLTRDKNYLVVIDNEASDCFINIHFYFTNKEVYERQTETTTFMLSNGDRYTMCTLYIPYDEEDDVIYLNSIAYYSSNEEWIQGSLNDFFEDKVKPLIYVYEMPYKIDIKAIL